MEREREREREKERQRTRPRPTQPHLLSNARDPNPIVNCPPPPPPPRPRLLFLPVPKRPSESEPKSIRTDLKTYGPRAQKSTRLLSSYLRLLTPLRTAIYSTPYCSSPRVLLSYHVRSSRSSPAEGWMTHREACPAPMTRPSPAWSRRSSSITYCTRRGDPARAGERHSHRVGLPPRARTPIDSAQLPHTPREETRPRSLSHYALAPSIRYHAQARSSAVVPYGPRAEQRIASYRQTCRAELGPSIPPPGPRAAIALTRRPFSYPPIRLPPT